MRAHACRHRLLALITVVAAMGGLAARRGWTDEDKRTYAAKEWSAPGGDEASTRYSNLTEINKQTVKNLRGAWMVDVPDERTEATLLVVDGRMFVVTMQGKVMALNPETGANLWTFTPPMPYSGKRGIGIGEGMLFLGLRDSNVIAISQETGQMVWMSHHGPEIPSQGIATAPAYGNGVVVAVVSLGDNFLRGRAIGLDAKTGKVLWSWDAIPGPGQPGHETWPQNNDSWKYGGGAIWTTPSVDEKLGLVYFGTGNAVPQFGGGMRPGNNLYDNCVIALDIKTGKMRWYFQAIHHDIWEADMGTPMVLYDTNIGGQMRKVVAAARTDGEFFLLDRETGKPLLPVEERPVKQDLVQMTSPTQPFTVGAERVGPECVEKDMVPAGFVGGCYFEPLRTDIPNKYVPLMTIRQAPLSYNPESHYLYAVACVTGNWMQRGPTGWEFVRPQLIPGSKQYGLIAAVDGRTAKIGWEKKLPWAECEGSGGSLSTAGGLLFHLEPDGVFYAYDASTGEALWHFQTGQTGGFGGNAGPSAASAMSYEVNGHQYIAVADSHAVMAFKLNGSLGEQPAPPAPPSIRDWQGRIAETSSIQIGAERTYTIASAEMKISYLNDSDLVPTRAKVTAGTAITFHNTSRLPQTIAARDGSWSTGTIDPGQAASVTVTKAGTYEYISNEHPWMMGQLIVEPANEEGASALSGVYTKEQAARGQAAYKQACAACHLDDLSGTERIPALAGDAFITNWKDKSVGDLYTRIRTTMPQGNVGSLSAQTYADILAFMLQSNEFPAGDSELGTSEDKLSQIVMKRH